MGRFIPAHQYVKKISEAVKVWPATRTRRATAPGEPDLEPPALEDLDRDEGETDDPEDPGDGPDDPDDPGRMMEDGTRA